MRRARAAFVRMAPVNDDGGPIELGLKESLVGIVADSVRHHAFGVRDHALRGDDGVTFDAAPLDHASDDNRAGQRCHAPRGAAQIYQTQGNPGWWRRPKRKGLHYWRQQPMSNSNEGLKKGRL